MKGKRTAICYFCGRKGVFGRTGIGCNGCTADDMNDKKESLRECNS